MNIRQFSLLKFFSLFAAIFGGMTLVSGGSVIFSPSVQAAAGNIVMPVVWFNFISGFAYLLAAWGLWWERNWGLYLSVGLFLSYLVVDIFLAKHILTGGSYESRTLSAMAFRTLVWAVIPMVAYRRLRRGPDRGKN